MLRFIEMTNGAAGYTNRSNGWIFIYSNATVTMKDSGGRTSKTTTTPNWLPPGWNVTTGTATDVLFGLSGDTIQDFAGFLSKSAVAPFLTSNQNGGVNTFLSSNILTARIANPYSTWANVYSGKTLAAAPAGIALSTGGQFLVAESGTDIFFVDVAGNAVDSGKPTGTPGQSTGSSSTSYPWEYWANVASVSPGVVNVFNSANFGTLGYAFLFAINTVMAIPVHIYISTTGQYILIFDATTGFELWKGT